MALTKSAVLPAVPVVPAVKGTTWPEGFSPGKDKVTLTRTIQISSATEVRAIMETEGGKSRVSVVTANKSGSRLDYILLADVPATVVAMNILTEWVKAESERHVVQPPAPSTGKTADPDDDEPEDDEDEEDLEDDD